MPGSKERKAVAVVGRWLSEYLPEVRMLSPGTIESYGKTLQIYHAYLKGTGGPNGERRLKRDGLLAAGMGNFDAAHVAGFVRFECNEFLYARVLGPRGLMKLGAMCCHADIINYGELPYTDFIRTQALCQGGDGCDSRFVRHATDAGDGWERNQSVWPRHALSVRGNAPRPPRPRWPSALSPSPRMCARAAFTLRTPASCSLKSFVR